MSNPYNPADAKTQMHTKTLQVSDIKSLIERLGKTTIGGMVLVLKSPAPTDPKLQEISKDPAFSVKSIGITFANGECEYELSANGKSVTIKVDFFANTSIIGGA